MSWRNVSKGVESKGLACPRVTRLADLAARREITESQYFTPSDISSGIWSALSEWVESIKSQCNGYISIFDNSAGSGRLFEGAPVEDAYYCGADVDSRCINALGHDAASAGIEHDFLTGSMADLEVSGFDFAVINPPFSITLQSPNLTNYGCNNFGKFGLNSSALSHEYALEQALLGARVVAAVLPISMDEYCRSKKSLVSVVKLPKSTFLSEGANVLTAVYFFASGSRCTPTEINLESGSNWPTLRPHTKYAPTKTRFLIKGTDYAEKRIKLPVTGDKRVELHHHNRKIVLKFHCGFVEAKVKNALLFQVGVGKRLAKEIKYSGDGQFLLDVLLMQSQPEEQLELLASRINSLGGDACVSKSLRGFYNKLVKRQKIALTPMRRIVQVQGNQNVAVVAKRRCLLEPGNFNSPSVTPNDVLTAVRKDGDYEITHDGQTVRLRQDELAGRFDIQEEDLSFDNDWKVIHEGLNHHFPEVDRHHKTRISKTVGSFLAPFQISSLAEGLISPYGYIGAWEQGSGKARYALSLALLHSGRSLVLVESGLLPEMVREIKKIGLDSSLYKILNSGDMPTAKINLASYATLRAGTRITYKKTEIKKGKAEEVSKTKIVRTNAEKWRRKFNVVLCDEGGLLANLDTQQTKAVKRLSARKLIVLDGTPQRNYPRDLLPLCVATAGNGVSHQPYGVKGKPALNPHLINSANHSQRGEDLFFENHVVTQWVTNEFKEDLQAGGKREVPKINNLSLFRSWLSPNIQRRLRSEPDLAEFNNCPTPTREVVSVNWDDGHLHHYLKVATEFAHWYKSGQLKNNSLVTVLARIGAVQRAANSPHVESKSSMDTYWPMTSKQKFALSRLEHWHKKGRKIILYAQSPAVLERLHNELKIKGIGSVLFTGKQNIKKRAQALDDEFRFGDKQILLSSWVGQRGLNLEQANVVMFYERSWSSATEEQCIYRTQRPSQTYQVTVEYLHLLGSIDSYAAQLSSWKSRSASAGLDFGAQAGEDEEFLHLDTLLNRFCDDVLGMSPHALKEMLGA